MSTSPVAAQGPQVGRRSAQVLTRVVRSPSLRLIGRRVATAVPVLWGVTLLTFAVLNLMPGSAARQLLGADASPAEVQQLQAEMGLDRPAWVRYWEWLQGAVTGDLGTSLASGQPVVEVMAPRLAVTFELVGYAFALSVLFAVPVALFAARKPNRFVDRLSMVVSMSGLSLANYVLALVLVLVFAVQLGAFPAIGFTPLSEGVVANLRSLTLPAVSIAFSLFCFYARFLRGDLLEQMQGEDYIVTARAKGVGPWQVLVRHAFRNSLFGLLTIVGLNLGTLIGGTVIIEQIFGLPGIGQLLLESISSRDVMVVQACVLVFAACVVAANLLVDLLYAVLDPRIRHG